MAKSIFVIGIGGTGMRCLESFIHLCAMGMFDDTEVNMLALDTDKDNGNFTRLRDLKNYYQNLKGGQERQVAHTDTQFSAKINYYEFTPDYSSENNLSKIMGYSSRNKKSFPNPDNKYHNAIETDIADLLFTEDVREFDLNHGYRAQTHLGSLLMYDSLVNDDNKNSQFKQFAAKLIRTTDDPRVFIFGSVFGGTGASSIPIIPRAIEAVTKKENDNQVAQALYGSVILTGYFSFNYNMSNDERTREKIVATSERFAFNSQAALMFYEDDASVNDVYSRLYLLGSREIKEISGKNSVKTGGKEQQNNAHYLELMAAFAAYDFFNAPKEVLKEGGEDKFYFIHPDIKDARLSFENFTNNQDFRKKFGMLVAASYLGLIDKYDLYTQATIGKSITGYENISQDEKHALHKYFEKFNLWFDGDQVEDGWLRQLDTSAGGMLFDAKAFGIHDKKSLSKLDFNKHLYADDKANTFSTGLLGGDIFDKVRSEMNKVPDNLSISNTNERLIHRVYHTLCQLYNFK